MIAAPAHSAGDCGEFTDDLQMTSARNDVVSRAHALFGDEVLTGQIENCWDVRKQLLIL